jgi:hypothetical protein
MKKTHFEWDEGKDKETRKSTMYLFRLRSMPCLILIAS